MVFTRPRLRSDDSSLHPLPPEARASAAHSFNAKRLLHTARGVDPDGLVVALDPLRAFYSQAHMLPPGTSNGLFRPPLQRCVEADHAGDVVVQWLTLHNR